MHEGYISSAMERAEFKILEDGTIFGEIPGFPGVFSNAVSEEAAREELEEVLESWIEVRISHGLDIPGAGKNSI